MQIRQAMLLGLTFNLYRLRHRRDSRGCQQSYLEAKSRYQGEAKDLRAPFVKFA